MGPINLKALMVVKIAEEYWFSAGASFKEVRTLSGVRFCLLWHMLDVWFCFYRKDSGILTV